VRNQLTGRIEAFVREVGERLLPTPERLASLSQDDTAFHRLLAQFESYALSLGDIHFVDSKAATDNYPGESVLSLFFLPSYSQLIYHIRLHQCPR